MDGINKFLTNPSDMIKRIKEELDKYLSEKNVLKITAEVYLSGWKPGCTVDTSTISIDFSAYSLEQSTFALSAIKHLQHIFLGLDISNGAKLVQIVKPDGQFSKRLSFIVLASTNLADGF